MISSLDSDFFTSNKKKLQAAVALSDADFLLAKGANSHILITSVHGKPHLRQGAVKQADTGSLLFSYWLAKALKASWVGVIKEGLLDNNVYESTSLKTFLTELPEKPKICIDIHTCNAYRPFDLEIGTGSNESDIRAELQLQEHLNNSGYLTIINQIFCAKGISSQAQTMTNFWQQKGIRAFQIEIASSFLVAETRQDVHSRSKLLYQIARGIEEYEKNLIV